MNLKSVGKFIIRIVILNLSIKVGFLGKLSNDFKILSTIFNEYLNITKLMLIAF